MREVIWSDEALDEFDEAIGYIALDNRYAADRVADAIEATADGLSRMATGRKGRVGDTYEKVVKNLPYIIAYAINLRLDGTEDIYILHIIHTARNWKPDSWPKT